MLCVHVHLHCADEPAAPRPATADPEAPRGARQVLAGLGTGSGRERVYTCNVVCRRAAAWEGDSSPTRKFFSSS